MPQVLALAMRPKTFEELIGQDVLIKRLRGHYAEGRMPQAWLFTGETGSGKTTIARIMATSLQCRHTKVFGTPCSKCLGGDFQTTEINTSDITGIDDLRNTLQGYTLSPGLGSRRRVYVLDEAQRLSKPAQNLLLKYFEDCPRTTVWFICTTEADKIIAPLRRRCIAYAVSSLDMEGIRVLVKRALAFIKCDRASGELIEALWSSGVTSSGLVVNAVEKYAAGASGDEAAREVTTTFDTYALCRALIKGDLAQAMGQIKEAKKEDIGAIRRSVANYMRAIIQEETTVNQRTTIVADSIFDLLVHVNEDSLQLPLLVATLYRICKRFAPIKH